MKRALFWVGAATVSAWLAWVFSPWPSALYYRVLMDWGGVAAHEALAKHVPPGIEANLNLFYHGGNRDARLDLFRPQAGKDEILPLVLWVHGGAFLSGSKDQISNYLRILASKGFAVAGVEYSLAPGARYPTPVHEVSTALQYLEMNAGTLKIDSRRIFLAGDSAGAQVAAQLTALISDESYARRIGLEQPIDRQNLRGAVLFCGFYDATDLKVDGAFGGFLTTALWSYFGEKSLSGDARIADFSITRNISAGFPPLFISAGNADPLLPQSKALETAAREQGIVVDSLFFPETHEPQLKHEYQFNLDIDAGQLALQRLEAFLKENVK